MPKARNAARQPYICAISPPMDRPSNTPRFGPIMKKLMASDRRLGGYMSAIIEIDGAMPPASPTATLMRAMNSCQ